MIGPPRKASRHNKTLPILKQIDAFVAKKGKYPRHFIPLEQLKSNLLYCESCEFCVEYKNGTIGCKKKFKFGCGGH